jgi:hypothetical protein
VHGKRAYRPRLSEARARREKSGRRRAHLGDFRSCRWNRDDMGLNGVEDCFLWRFGEEPWATECKSGKNKGEGGFFTLARSLAMIQWRRRDFTQWLWTRQVPLLDSKIQPSGGERLGWHKHGKK